MPLFHLDVGLRSYLQVLGVERPTSCFNALPVGRTGHRCLISPSGHRLCSLTHFVVRRTATLFGLCNDRDETVGVSVLLRHTHCSYHRTVPLSSRVFQGEGRRDRHTHMCTRVCTRVVPLEDPPKSTSSFPSHCFLCCL